MLDIIVLFFNLCNYYLSYFSDLLPYLSKGASCFGGYQLNLHRPEFPSARGYSVLHAQPFDFTGTGTHGAICGPTFLHYVCLLTMYSCKKVNKDFAIIPSLSEGDFSLNFVKLLSQKIRHMHCSTIQ